MAGKKANNLLGINAYAVSQLHDSAISFGKDGIPKKLKQNEVLMTEALDKAKQENKELCEDFEKITQELEEKIRRLNQDNNYLLRNSV